MEALPRTKKKRKYCSANSRLVENGPPSPTCQHGSVRSIRIGKTEELENSKEQSLFRMTSNLSLVMRCRPRHRTCSLQTIPCLSTCLCGRLSDHSSTVLGNG